MKYIIKDILKLFKDRYPTYKIKYVFPYIGNDIYYIISEDGQEYICAVNGRPLKVPKKFYINFLNYLHDYIDPEAIISEATVKWEVVSENTDGTHKIIPFLSECIKAEDLIRYIRMLDAAIDEEGI